ncbi:MAG: hypothetical protein EBZ67_11155 [Chitinophagia bacterium]|nr:hypothetical protein [Chitinophagia bacterium]
MERQAQSSSTIEVDKQAIIAAIGNPGLLEEMYRRDRRSFRKAFDQAYPALQGELLAEAWQERLKPDPEPAFSLRRSDWAFVAIAVAIAGTILKLPEVFQMKEEDFYPRNLSFSVLPLLMAYFVWKQGLGWKERLWIFVPVALAAVHINLLPRDLGSDTLTLACIHLPLLLWGLLGFAYAGRPFGAVEPRVAYLRFNGDLIVMSAVLAIAAGIFSAITIGLFSLIGVDINTFYGKWVIVYGAPGIPILATLLVRSNPQLVGRVSPIVARIFTPLVGLMLLAFLIAMGVQGKDPYRDREFLLIFNILLIGVMAIVLFSVGEASRAVSGRFNLVMLFVLSALAAINNAIALSAIAYRLFEFGWTPNRIAVLGGNVLIMVHLLGVCRALWQWLSVAGGQDDVDRVIGRYLPLYVAWTVVVVFALPHLFQYR